MKHNHSKKKYFLVSVFNTGKIKVDEADTTNFHPSYVNMIMKRISTTQDYVFSACDENNIEKTKIKILKALIKEVTNELRPLQKQLDAYDKAYKNLTQN